MTERYLFGDSTPFENGYDFLAELKSFVGAASKALALSYEAEQLDEGLGEHAQGHLQEIEAVQGFFDGLIDVVADRMARSGVPQLIGPHAREILDHIEEVGTKARSTRVKDLDAAQLEATSQIRDNRAELKRVLSDYLLNDPLLVDSWAISLVLSGDRPHGQVVMAHPGDLTTSFEIDVSADGTWGRPRKVSELVQGMSLQVGFKKAFLRSSLHPVIAALDDLVIAALELGPDSFEVRLRKRPDSTRDAFVLTRDLDADGKWTAKVTRIDEKAGESDAPYTSLDEDAARMRELGQALRRQCNSLLSRKKRLIYAQLDGHDVFERSMVRALFERIANRLAPIAAQVSAHSPNPSELSLKLERDGGRREEIYLNKQDLIDMCAGLPDETLELFHRLAFLPVPASADNSGGGDNGGGGDTGAGSASAPPPPKHPL